MGVKVRVDGLMVLTGLAVAVGAYVYSKREAVADKLNPTSTNNVIYDGVVGGVGRTLTGDDSWSLGSQIYDWTH